MVRHATDPARRVPWRRLFVVAGLAAALVIPFGYTFMQFWNASGDDLTFTQRERAGVEYIRPLTKLVGVLTDAQTATVAGARSNAGALRGAVAAVDSADRQHGGTLGTEERWANLSQRLSQLADSSVTGRQAYATYSESIDLTLALMAKAGDTSNLILDPQLDSYYLMDTTLLRLPAMLVDSGRLVDLARLGGGEGDSSAAAQVLAARDRVAASATAIDVGLKKSFDATGSSTLGPSLLGHVDRLRSVTAEIAPSTSLIDLPVSLTDVDRVAGARDRMRDAAIQLDDATLTELDGLLVIRQDGIDRQRTGVLVAILIAALVGGCVLWSRLPERGRYEDEDEEYLEPAGHRKGVAGSSEGEGDEAPELMDARQLLSQGELVRVGRAVRPSRRERLHDTAE